MNTIIRAANHTEAKAILDAHPAASILDVRTEDEYITGHIEGAVLLPFDEIDETSARDALPDPEGDVLVYCRSGRRSAIAARKLVSLGYASVYDLGGLAGWPYELV